MFKRIPDPNVLILSCTLLLTMSIGCNNDSQSSSSNTDSTPGPVQTKGAIGVSLLTLKNPFFKVIGDNITAEAKKHGYETIVLSANEDVATQSNQVKDFIVRKVSAIVLSPCESRSIVPVIQEANAAGIPVITVDIPCNEPGVKILTQVATDNYGGGKEAGKAMIEALGEAGGKVAILHYRQAESCRLRVKGFREIIGARAALEKADKQDQVLIVGFDGQPEGKQAIKDGKIYADPIQFPDRMGIEVVKAIISHSKGQEVPSEQLIPTSLYRKEDGQKDPDLQ